MKRILSVFISAAILFSAVSVSANAWSFEKAEELITTVNEMSFTLDKEEYAPGDTLTITAKMDSIWGDPDIRDDSPGFEGQILPNAYGMDVFTATLVFPTDVFTPNQGKDFNGTSTIIGYNDTETYDSVIVTKTPLADAKEYGYYQFLIKSSFFNADEDEYAFFNGSGDLCQWELVINKNAAPGTYKLPIGPFNITDYETGAMVGLPPQYEFFGNWYTDIGNADSILSNRAVYYNSTTEEYVGGDSTKGAYITIVITGNGSEIPDPEIPDNPEPPVDDDTTGCTEHEWGDVYTLVRPTTNSIGKKAHTCFGCYTTEIVEDIPILEIKYGDCDMNGKINLSDVSVMMKHLAKWSNLYFSPENADVTHDDKITLADASKMLKYIAKFDFFV